MFGIYVFGDSITFGRGESPCVGWAGRLKEQVERKGAHHCLFNLGIPGDTTKGLLRRFENEAKARIHYHRPEDRFVIIIAIGINDTVAQGSPDKVQTKPLAFEKNIRKLIRSAKQHTKEMVIVGLTPVDEERTQPYEGTYITNERIKAYTALLRKSAEEEGVEYIELFEPLVSRDLKHLLTDGLHPSSEGYDEMHAIISAELKEKDLLG